MRDQYTSDMWNENVAFYIDGTCFTFISDSRDQARPPEGQQPRSKCSRENGSLGGPKT